MNRWTLLISAGVGPWEARVFVARLAATLEQWLEHSGFRIESVTVVGDEAAPASITLALEGAPTALEALLGTHALVERSPRRERASRKRWYVGVSLHVELTRPAVAIDPAELEFQTCRAGGPGGQHVNTTDSAVRVLHRPSGIAVRVTTERSQHANRRIALERLEQVLADRAAAAVARDRRTRRHTHYQLERGNPVVVWRPDPRAPGRLEVESGPAELLQVR